MSVLSVSLEFERDLHQFGELLSCFFHILIIFVEVPDDLHAFDVFERRQHIEDQFRRRCIEVFEFENEFS